MDDDDSREFFDIAGNLVESEANSFLDARLEALRRWERAQSAVGDRADLRTLIEKMMREPAHRGPAVILLATAMWRLKGMENANAKH